ncbi:hypothetical protein ACK3TF_001496 [Chlorella vulgaris]
MYRKATSPLNRRCNHVAATLLALHSCPPLTSWSPSIDLFLGPLHLSNRQHTWLQSSDLSRLQDSNSRPPAALPPPQMAAESITELQATLLARLERARAALSRTPPGLGRDQVREVIEELGHSGALLATIKKDLDAIFARLVGIRQALAVAFPQHMHRGPELNLEDEVEALQVTEKGPLQKADREGEAAEAEEQGPPSAVKQPDDESQQQAGVSAAMQPADEAQQQAGPTAASQHTAEAVQQGAPCAVKQSDDEAQQQGPPSAMKQLDGEAQQQARPSAATQHADEAEQQAEPRRDTQPQGQPANRSPTAAMAVVGAEKSGRGGGGGGRGGGRGRGAGRGGRGGRGERSEKPKTAEDLEREMDDYWRQDEKIASKKLNEDMDDYWAGAPKKGEAAAPAAAAATAATTEPAAEAAAEAAPAAEEVVAE